MFKKMTIGILAAVVVIAGAASAYNQFTQSNPAGVQAAGPIAPAADPAVSEGSVNSAAPLGAATPGAAGPGTVEAGADYQRQEPGAAQGQGGQGGQNRSGWGGGGQGNGTPDPRNGLGELTTMQGTVSGYAPPYFTLTTQEGQQVEIQLGNLNYLNSLGFSLQDGEAVSVTGATDASGGFAVQQITISATGQIYTLRDDFGRPSWRGGRGNK